MKSNYPLVLNYVTQIGKVFTVRDIQRTCVISYDCAMEHLHALKSAEIVRVVKSQRKFPLFYMYTGKTRASSQRDKSMAKTLWADRDLVELRKKYSVIEIARSLGVSRQTVYGRLKRISYRRYSDA
jgi:predicted DNA-binding transcriptional regulator